MTAHSLPARRSQNRNDRRETAKQYGAEHRHRQRDHGDDTVFVTGDCPCAGSNPAIPAATPASSRPMTATIVHCRRREHHIHSRCPLFNDERDQTEQHAAHNKTAQRQFHKPSGNNSNTGEIKAKARSEVGRNFTFADKEIQQRLIPLNSSTVAGLI